MIDTLTVGALDFEVLGSNKLIKRIDTDQGTGEIFEKSFYNGEKLNLTIDSRGFRLHFSYPKLYGLGDNFNSLGPDSFEPVIVSLEKNLEDIGVIANIDKMKVLRLDLFKNVETSKTFNSYSDVLRKLDLKRTHRREYQDGFLTSNTLRELCFYNKVKELRESLGADYVEKVYNFDSENVIRGELRFLRHQEVKKNGIEFLIEIPDKWTSLKETYSNYMSEVFKYDLRGGDMIKKLKGFEPDVNFAMYALRTRGREAIKALGYYPYSFVNRDELMDTLKEKYSRDRAYKVYANIERYKESYLGLFNSLEYKVLYSELKEKFLDY